jgi:hypothetical protein
VKTAIGTIAKTLKTSLLNAVRDLIACLPKIVPITLLHQYWRKMSNPHKFHPNRLLTQEEIEVRVWASVVLIVTVILAGIVIFMLYSLAFVVQPIKSMAPIDQSFAKMLNDIVLLIVGGIGGVMSRKGVQAVADKVSPPPTTTFTPGITTTPATVSSGLPVWVNPPLDEEWRAPPPPTTPPDFLHPEREEIAKERAEASR